MNDMIFNFGTGRYMSLSKPTPKGVVHATPKANKKRCACSGCKEKILAKHVMCTTHWWTITQLQRDAIVDALKHQAVLKKQNTHAYLSALQNALETIRAKEAK